jgi:RNase P subunit RPR2
MSEAAPTTRLAEPDSRHRWRCAGCGNLTRFDVVRSQRSAEFWHVDLSGDARVEESETLESSIDSVTCRWCGRSDAIELVERPGAQPQLPDLGTG